MKQNQFEFKPFDKVIVKNPFTVWHVDIYSHDICIQTDHDHVCIGGNWEKCIPYNKHTEHLIGTDNEYNPTETNGIKYEVVHGFGKDLQVEVFNEEQFKHFINIAVCNNKDVKDFTVNVIIDD